jgi:hypothetical protein
LNGPPSALLQRWSEFSAACKAQFCLSDTAD